MIITGIGSRKTPDDVCNLFTELGQEVKIRNDWLRSGHADGSDYAFELGAKEHCIVYLPWNGFNKEKKIWGIPRTSELRDEVLEIVFKHEPYARELSQGVQRIKSRNVYQILGEDLKSPSDVVICWTPNGEIVGGTGLAIKIAMDHGIPVVNIGDENTSTHLDEILSDIMERVGG